MNNLARAAQVLIAKYEKDPSSLGDEISNLKSGLRDEPMSSVIVEVEGLEGEVANIFVSPDKVYMVVSRESGDVLDSGYISLEEVSKAWPEAVNAAGLEI